MSVCAHGCVQVCSCALVLLHVGVQSDESAHVCLYMNTDVCIKVFAHGCVFFHTFACTWVECACRCARMCLHVHVNAQVCVRGSLCTWVCGSAHLCARRCVCRGAAEVPGNRRFLEEVELTRECWRAQGREAGLCALHNSLQDGLER